MKTTAHYLREKIMSRAYQWAIREKNRFGITGEPMELTPDADNMWEGNYGCLISIFYDPVSKMALMRRDWLGALAMVQYNVVKNYELFRVIAPKSADFMENNAMRIYGHNSYMQ